MITYIFRKKSTSVFSIENVFGELAESVLRSGREVQRLELPFVSTGLISVLRNVWYVARQPNKGLLHVTGDVHYAALLCPLSKVIITVHDCVALRRRAGLKGLSMRILWFALPLRLASAVTAISDQTKQEVLRTVAVPARKITVIPNFVDPSFHFTERPFCDDHPRVLHIGTTPNKNLSRVIAALRDLRCVLVIIGRLPPAGLRELEEARIRYENLYDLDHASIREQYRLAEIISFPSTYEGFGMPILEGQAVGRPVLTSNLEPMRGVAGIDGALFVEPHSVESIRAGFRALATDAALRARLVAAGMANCAKFKLDAVAARYLALYHEMGH